MAPILKEADTSAATTAASASPLAKSPTETPSRPQPVAIEIPVTVNGARTVEGSDKREPFSETTQTVLVFGQGAVVRINTPLAPGQLIFLTNEKSKKEVVCQVVKAKTGGSGGAYVELQFTEPAAGFWGLKTQSGSPVAPAASAPSAARQVPAAIPAVPKAIAPPPQVAGKPDLPIAAAPAAPLPPAVKPAAAVPPPAPIAHEVPATPEPQPPAPPVFVAPPATAVPELPAVPTPAPGVSAASQTPAPSSTDDIPPALASPKPALPVAPLSDYSKEIEAVFAPHAQTSQPPAPKPVEESHPPGSSSPSSEELKLQAARLQAQLSSMLFTETTSAPPASKTDPALTEVSKKVLDLSQEVATPTPRLDTKTVPPARKPSATSLSVDDEVKIPAWLAPLSQSAEPSVPAKPASSEAPSESGILIPGDEFPAVSSDSSRRESAVFGGQLLGESANQTESPASSGSKKGLLIGLAATVLVVAGGGAWYYRQPKPAVKPVVATPAASIPAAPPQQVTSSSLPAATAATTPAPSVVNPPPTSQPTRSVSPASNPTPAPSSAVLKTSNPPVVNAEPAESSRKPAFNDARLATPLVNRGAASSENGEPMPSIGTSVPTPGVDELAATASSHRAEPVAPAPVGGVVKAAHLIKSVPPVYPAMARAQHISGDVEIDALIDESGNVSAVKVISGPTLLHRAALDAVKQWKYSPAMLDGKATSMHLTVSVQFRAQ